MRDLFITVEGVEYNAKTVGTIQLTNITGSGTVSFVPHEIPDPNDPNQPLDPGPHILDLEGVHKKLIPCSLELACELSGTDGINDPGDALHPPITAPILSWVSEVNGYNLIRDSRGLGKQTPFDIAQIYFSKNPGETISIFGGDTNTLVLTMPEGTFGNRLVTLQVYSDANTPGTIYDVKKSIQEGEGAMAISLLDLPRRVISGEKLNILQVRTDKISLADFVPLQENGLYGDGRVDLMDYAAFAREYGKVGNSLADLASFDPNSIMHVGTKPDGKVSLTDLKALCELYHEDLMRRAAGKK